MFKVYENKVILKVVFDLRMPRWGLGKEIIKREMPFSFPKTKCDSKFSNASSIEPRVYNNPRPLQLVGVGCLHARALCNKVISPLFAKMS